jgi:hypothetical protein
MKKSIFAIAMIAIFTTTGCKKNEGNKVNPSVVTRNFSGTAFSKIDVAVVTTEGSDNQTADVSIKYAAGNPVSTTYRDTIKIVASSGVYTKGVPTIAEGATSALKFTDLPLKATYKCLFIRSGISTYPDTLITIVCN